MCKMRVIQHVIILSFSIHHSSLEHLITCPYVQHKEDFFNLSFWLAFIDFLSVPNISIWVVSGCIRAWTVKSCEISVITICFFMDFTEFYRNFSAKNNISKPSVALLWHQSNNNQTTDLGRVHLLNRYNYRFTFSGYVAAYFFIGIWKRNDVFSLVLCDYPHSWNSQGMSFQKGMCLSSDFLPNHILKPLISILQKDECSFCITTIPPADILPRLPNIQPPPWKKMIPLLCPSEAALGW